MATFTFKPLYSWSASRGFRVLVTEFESGKEQRRYRGKEPREWGLAFTNKRGEIDKIEAFFETQKGPTLPFSWTPPGETKALTVRFKDASLNIKYMGLNKASLELTLREVL